MDVLQLFQEEELIEDVLNKISAAAQAIKKLKHPFYNILRCQYAIPKLAFERELFARGQDEGPAGGQEYLPLSFTQQETYSGHQLIIDLQREADVKEVLFAIQEVPNDPLRYRFKARL